MQIAEPYNVDLFKNLWDRSRVSKASCFLHRGVWLQRDSALSSWTALYLYSRLAHECAPIHLSRVLL